MPARGEVEIPAAIRQTGAGTEMEILAVAAMATATGTEIAIVMGIGIAAVTETENGGEIVIAMAIVIIAAMNAIKCRLTTIPLRTARRVTRITIRTTVAALTSAATTTVCTRALMTDGADRLSIRIALTSIKGEPAAIVPAKATKLITKWLIATAFWPDIAKATKIGGHTLWEENSGGSEGSHANTPHKNIPTNSHVSGDAAGGRLLNTSWR